MDENEDILFNECKLQITKTGQAMNIFSFVAVAGMVGLMAGGLALLAFGSRIDANMPYYLQQIISFAGIISILVSALLVPPILYMRRAVHAAKQIAIGNELFPAAEFLHQCHLLWKYLTIFIAVAFALAFLATVVICFVILATRNVF